MDTVRLIMALHDHQPVGNFDNVFEAAYNESYLPFLETLEGYPEIPFALHTSGPLLEWLERHRPEYIARVRGLVQTGRVEILGGGFYEPVLTMIPRRDRVAQIRDFSAYLTELFHTRIRGMWMPERVWEQGLVADIAEAGIEYTLLDDESFARTGLEADDLFGYYLTEDEGRLLKVFPICERLRYYIPFKAPHDTYEYLRGLARLGPNTAAVFADDGEKFGSWPDTREHVYAGGWLRHFCDMITANLEWLEPTTFARTLDETLPRGKVYLPDGSYREMTEWVLPSERFKAYMRVVKDAQNSPSADRLKPFLRAGGFWRNFRAKYEEVDEMYARMLGVSRRLAAAEDRLGVELLESARRHLHRGQCNCPYWHGAFGGLYLPHLRNAVYRELIAASNAIDEAEGRPESWVSATAADYNLDARQELCLENDRLIAYIRPARGGHLYELDVRHAGANLLATLDRRPEPYHDTIRATARGETIADGRAAITERVILKQEGLDRALVYDTYPRKALVDHFFEPGCRIEDVAACRAVDGGDFAQGAYLATLRRHEGFVELVMERPGRAFEHLIRVRKTIRLSAGSPLIEVDYELSDLPPGVALDFGVEMNLAAMAGHADDRYYADLSGTRLGCLDSRLDLEARHGLALNDEWLDLSVSLAWSRPAVIWCFPIETVSQSEGGFELVYQSSAVIPRWNVQADASGRWALQMALSATPIAAAAAAEQASSVRELVTL